MRKSLCFEDFLFVVENFIDDRKEICEGFPASCATVDETILALLGYNFKGLIWQRDYLKLKIFER